MKWLILLFSYHAVSGRFFWSNVGSNNNIRQKNNNFGDIFSDVLNDFNLDISFTPNTNSFSNEYIIDNQDTNNMNNNNNYFIDESPSSMFTFPSIFNDNTFTYKQSKPLYLTIQSPQAQKSNTYTLRNTNKVNGNTFRYSVNTNDNNNNNQITETLSTHKMYLCKTASCSNNNGIEMKNVFDNFMDKMDNKYKNYMHLIPTSTMVLFENESENDQDKSIMNLNGLMDMTANWLNNININKEVNHENHHFSLRDYALNKANKLLNTFNMNRNTNDEIYTNDQYYDTENVGQYIDDTDYDNYIDENIVYDKAENNDIDDGTDENNIEYNNDMNKENEKDEVRIDYIDGFMDNNNRILGDNSNANSNANSIFFMEMTAIIIFIMICGVFYAGWRFLLDRREKQREMDYYNMNGMNEL